MDPQQVQMEQQQAGGITPTLPEDARVLPPSPGQPSVGELALSGQVTGPIPALARFLTRIPGLGIDFPEQASIAAELPNIRNRIVKALQTNPRYAVMERQDIIANLDIDPKLVDSPQAFVNRLIGVDQFLERLENEMFEVVTGRAQLVSGETRQHAMDTWNTVRYWRGHLLPQRLETREQIERFRDQMPPGTTFTARNRDVLGPEGGEGWGIWQVAMPEDFGGF
jgi:hypothetical protein